MRLLTEREVLARIGVLTAECVSWQTGLDSRRTPPARSQFSSAGRFWDEAAVTKPC